MHRIAFVMLVAAALASCDTEITTSEYEGPGNRNSQPNR
jgi:hypothetical protein